MRTFFRVFLLLLVALPQAEAVTEQFCQLDEGGTAFQLNADATQAPAMIELTANVGDENGTAFLTSPIPTPAGTSFKATFQFQISNGNGGDGLAFVIQNASSGVNAIGPNGGQLGYGGISPSVEIEFDTYKDSWDTNSNHVALMLNGDYKTHVKQASPPFTMTAGAIIYAWVNYDGVGKTIAVYVATSPTQPSTPLFTNTLNLNGTVGSQAYFGFSAATGGGTEEHDLLAFELSTDGVPCGCPSDASCSGGMPDCGPSNYCVQCSATDSSQCTGATPACNLLTGMCGGCQSDNDCSNPTPICDPSTLICRGCTASSDCSGVFSACALSGTNKGECVECATASDCMAPTPQCDVMTNACVQCLKSSDCSGETPICSSGNCQGCSSDSDCSGATPACEATGQCGQCSGDNATACTPPSTCNLTTLTCTGCTSNADCSGTKPICNPTTTSCEGCTSSAQCTTGTAGGDCVTTGTNAGACEPATTCTSDANCPVDEPACQPSGQCGQCSATNKTACTGSSPHCDVTTGTCSTCASNADCTGTTPICNQTTHACSACSSDSDCGGAKPACELTGPTRGACGQCSAANTTKCVAPRTLCDLTSDVCVGCQSNADCSGTTPICGTSQLCRKCESDSDCGGATPACETSGACGQCSASNVSACMGTTPMCIAATHSCAGCQGSDDCPSNAPVCDPTSMTCQPCTEDSQCTGNAAGSACATSGSLQGQCVGCTSDASCSASVPKCDTSTSRCVACLTSADCTAHSPVCSPQKACVSCTGDADCAGVTSGQVCVTAAGPQQGECVACQTAGDCPDMMMCSLAVNACVQCESSSDCSGATPACNLNTLQCGCSHDTDCKPGDYCVPSMGTAGACVVGCHVTGGLSHCPVGDVCSVTTGGIGTCEVVPAVDAGPAMIPSAPVSSGCGCSPGGGSGMVWPAVAMLFAGLRRRRRVESREPSPTGMQ